jgi:Zn-dependent peptidase ImmA (M78 family)
MPQQFPQFGPLEHPGLVRHRVRDVSCEIRRSCGQTRLEQFDPERCAAYFGITIVYTILPDGIGGRILPTAQGARMELNSRDSRVRQRFTACHELAHLCFVATSPVLPRERGSRDDAPNIERREERLCDMIAAELLMPATRFKTRASRLPAALESVKVLSAMFGVSMPAALHRLSELAPWSFAWAEYTSNADGSIACRSRRVVVAGRVRSAGDRARITDQLWGALKAASYRAYSDSPVRSNMPKARHLAVTEFTRGRSGFRIFVHGVQY